MAKDEELSDEQITQLLKEAEERLKASKKQKPQSSDISALANSIPKFSTGKSIEPYITSTKKGATVDAKHLVSEEQRKQANGIRIVHDPVEMKKKAAEEKKATAGSDWYNLPKTNLTPELKRDLQLLKMRDVLDPKRFYKKDSSKNAVPEFSQVGTIIQGPTEYFSGRLSNKERKRTLVEEILAGEKATGRLKSKYNDIQAAKTSGRKAHYKKLVDSRRKGGVTKR